MPVEITIDPIDPCSDLIEPLAAEARGQGYLFVDRLLDEARSGENTFQKRGECFCGVFVNELLVGCGGVNLDPYVDTRVGRLRYIYVLRKFRRRGITASLVRELLRPSKSSFKTVRLRTSDDSADKFYDVLGFTRIDDQTATHFIEI
ncbi:MAG: GNAT family N-acetyltransferase [Paracoccaceae bacterium]|nr:GNAT family N-acetyltransferase [Paracoccaceae bacterium]